MQLNSFVHTFKNTAMSYKNWILYYKTEINKYYKKKGTYSTSNQTRSSEEENERLYDTEIKNIKLSQRIRSLNTTITTLQNYNLEMQSTIQQLKKRKYKTCDHKQDCRCDKVFCRHCQSASHQNESNHECDNTNCRSYYMSRYENCTCQQARCIHCTFQQTSFTTRN